MNATANKTSIKSTQVANKAAAKRAAAKAASEAASEADGPRKTAPKSLAKSLARRSAKPALLAGGNPQIAKADGDAPVQATIAAMPDWQRDVGLGRPRSVAGCTSETLCSVRDLPMLTRTGLVAWPSS